MNDPNAFGGPWHRPEDLVGTILADRYRVVKMLGDGGMGSVFLGEHVTLRKKVAIKVLHQELCRDQTQVDRFLQEARAASMIGHENIVDIVDFGSVPGGSVFFAMEYLEGEDLADLLQRERRLPWPRARELMLQIVRALRAAHDKGIIHRDLKPANCFLVRRSDGRDFVKLLDFGIAKVTDPEGGESSGLTRTGAVFGTAKYMAPEQACGEPADQRTDVYAAAICLYEFLTGQVPYDGDNFMRVLSRHLTEPLTLPSTMAPDAGITPAVEAIIVKALSKKPDDRYQNMAELEAALLAVGPDGNLSSGNLYEGPPQLAKPPQVPGGPGGTLWLPQGGQASLGPASQPPEGRGGTMVLDPAAAAQLDQPQGTLKLGPGTGPPPIAAKAEATVMMEGMGHDVLPRGSGAAAITSSPGGVGLPSTSPPLPETRPPTYGRDSTGGDHTIFAPEGRSTGKTVALMVVGGVLAVGLGGLAAYFLAGGGDGETSEDQAAVASNDAKAEVDKTETPEAKKPETPETPEIPAEKTGDAPPEDAAPAIPDAPKEADAPPPEDPPPGEAEKTPPSQPDRPKPRPNPPQSSPLKDSLGAKDVSKGFRKAEKAVKACKGALPGMKISIKASINADGDVLDAKPVGANAGTPLAQCVASAVKSKARFAKTKKVLDFQTFTFSF